jgi:hypothetical protein
MVEDCPWAVDVEKEERKTREIKWADAVQLEGRKWSTCRSQRVRRCTRSVVSWYWYVGGGVEGEVEGGGAQDVILKSEVSGVALGDRDISSE